MDVDLGGSSDIKGHHMMECMQIHRSSHSSGGLRITWQAYSSAGPKAPSPESLMQEVQGGWKKLAMAAIKKSGAQYPSKNNLLLS